VLATLFAGLFAIACGVAANLLTPAVRRALALEIPQLPSPRQQNEPEPESPPDIELLRGQNRRRLNEFLAQSYFYGVSYYAMFSALYLPLKFKTLGPESVLELSKTRIPIERVVPSEHFMTFALVGAFILYIPCWSLAVNVATLVARIWHNYQEVNAIRFGAFMTLAMLLFAFVICGHWIYLLYPRNSYLGSVLMPFMVMLFVAGFASSRR
jgi:hypothetical protein